MNFVTVSAQLNETPTRVYTSATTSAVRCMVTLPPINKKAPTIIEYNAYGKQAEEFLGAPERSLVYIHGAKLRFDINTKTFSIHAGTVEPSTAQARIHNNVILTGRCIKDISHDDARAFKTTADGLMIANQTISVKTSRDQADLFNFYAMNSVDDKLNNAELLANFTRKGTGITINTRIVTDAWFDKETKERRTNTKLQLLNMTLAPKPGSEPQPQRIASQTTVASSDNVASLWGGRTVENAPDPWNQASGGGLPDLPGHYGPAPTEHEEEVPF